MNTIPSHGLTQSSYTKPAQRFSKSAIKTTQHVFNMELSKPTIPATYCVHNKIRLGHLSEPARYHVRRYSSGSGVKQLKMLVYVCPDFGMNIRLPNKSRIENGDGMTSFLDVQWKTSSPILNEYYIVATSVEDAETLLSKEPVAYSVEDADCEDYPDLIYAYFETL